MKLLIVGTEIYYGTTLLTYKGLNRLIIITLVLTSDDEYGGSGHALKSIPTGIDIGGLGVIDVLHTTNTTDFLQPMFNTREVAKALTYYLLFDTTDV